MPILKNPKNAMFCHHRVEGLSAIQAHTKAGFSRHPSNAQRLNAREEIQNRIYELTVIAAAQASISKSWILEKLKTNLNQCMRPGNTFNPAAANKALELIGKELRMFVDRRHDTVVSLDNMTEEDFTAAGKILHAFEDAVESGTRVETWSELNYALHAALYKPANLPQAMQVIHSLNIKSDRYIRMQLLLTTGIDKAEQEHSDILNLCRQRDKAAASALLRKHILEAGQAIHDLLIQQQSKLD